MSDTNTNELENDNTQPNLELRQLKVGKSTYQIKDKIARDNIENITKENDGIIDTRISSAINKLNKDLEFSEQDGYKVVSSITESNGIITSIGFTEIPEYQNGAKGLVPINSQKDGKDILSSNGWKALDESINDKKEDNVTNIPSTKAVINYINDKFSVKNTDNIINETIETSIEQSDKLVTANTIYNALPNINGDKRYNGNSYIYAPTEQGNEGQVLISNNTTPEWANQKDICSGSLIGDNGSKLSFEALTHYLFGTDRVYKFDTTTSYLNTDITFDGTNFKKGDNTLKVVPITDITSKNAQDKSTLTLTRADGNPETIDILHPQINDNADNIANSVISGFTWDDATKSYNVNRQNVLLAEEFTITNTKNDGNAVTGISQNNGVLNLTLDKFIKNIKIEFKQDGNIDNPDQNQCGLCTVDDKGIATITLYQNNLPINAQSINGISFSLV